MMRALAALPTTIEPSSWKCTTLAVMPSPKAFGSTSTFRPRATDTHELLVPRSIPMATTSGMGSSGGPAEPLPRPCVSAERARA